MWEVTLLYTPLTTFHCLTQLCIVEDDQENYQLYRTELGEAALGEPLTDNQLMIYCEAWADAKGTLKFLVQRNAAVPTRTTTMDSDALVRPLQRYPLAPLTLVGRRAASGVSATFLLISLDSKKKANMRRRGVDLAMFVYVRSTQGPSSPNWSLQKQSISEHNARNPKDSPWLVNGNLFGCTGLIVLASSAAFSSRAESLGCPSTSPRLALAWLLPG